MSVLLVIVLISSVPHGCDLLWGNGPISLYGEAIDQNGSPVPGAVVSFQAVAASRFQIPLAIPMRGDQSIWRVEAVTGADGGFELHDGWGQLLFLKSIQGPRYTKAGLYDSFSFGRRALVADRTDRDHRAQFLCWNDAFKRILSREITSVVGPEKYTLSYRLGKVSKNGGKDENLAFQVIMPKGNPHAPYDWSVEIEGLLGKLADAKEILLPEVPRLDFVPILRRSMNARDPAWGRQMKIRLYFEGTDVVGVSSLNAGVDMTVTLAEDSQAATVTIKYVANFGNSRDLTPGPILPAGKK
jgi:hypothetical protein